MELNEVTRKLPPHLLQFVVDQPYNDYTPIDQAVWRYVMRQNYHHLQKVAHQSYVEGLKKTGVSIDNIPTMYGMNRILKEIGWAAVAVDGFIPPGAFMEFTKYNVLVIAADIRTIDHIEYTPAPDIIHESAGHAPIIAEPEFAEYLKYIGEVGSKAFSSRKDYELYEAIRHLSIIKGDPDTLDKEIEEAEKVIDSIQADMGESSEMAQIRNLHWWTVEYGLIGTVDDYKLYGAGLLSSIGESMSCLRPEVKKLPYSVEAAHCNYDITKPQPQLFVTPDFKHLTMVLNQFLETMAWKTGGLEAIQKAIYSEATATCVFSSGLQVSGTFTEVINNDKGEPVFFKTEGPSALAFEDEEMDGFGKTQLPDGFSSPVGKLLNSDKALENFEDGDLLAAGIIEGQASAFEFESGIKVYGLVKHILRNTKNQIMLVHFKNCEVSFLEKSIVRSEEYFMAVGERIISAFAGPADVEAFEPTVIVPNEKTHKIVYKEKTLQLHQLYRMVRKIRESKTGYDQLQEIWNDVSNHHPDDWLLSMEILEILEETKANLELAKQIRTYLETKKEKHQELSRVIRRGLNLIYEEERPVI